MTSRADRRARRSSARDRERARESVVDPAKGLKLVSDSILAAVFDDPRTDGHPAGEQQRSVRRFPWHDLSCPPHNPVTGKVYSGLNMVKLQAEASRRTRKGAGAAQRGCLTGPGNVFDPPHLSWATATQWLSAGLVVRDDAVPVEVLRPRGSQGRLTSFELYSVIELRDTAPTGHDCGEAERPALKRFSRLSQVANTALARAEAVVDGFMRKHGVAIRSSHRPGYRLQSDVIEMPALPTLAGFEATQHYYAVLMHECGHATGAASRLDRATLRNYECMAAAEELVAELCASRVCGRLGLATSARVDHQSYVKAWLALLKGDGRMLLSIVSDAERAGDFILASVGSHRSRPVRG